jgi:thiol-disulfide isomerase/thioredoxin
MSEAPSATETTTEAAGDYIPYESFVTSGDKYSDSKVVLFFNAVWCSTCQQARENIEASLGEIPENLAIVVVDFDSSIDLRKKYGVTVQHTFIEIDSAGEPLGKWSGSVTVDQIVEQLT